jgi:hypothetical protein
MRSTNARLSAVRQLSTVVSVGLAVVLLATTAVAAAATPSDLQDARVASARFNSVNQALEAGYGPLPEGVPLHECIAAFDGSGAMGFHYLNATLLDTTLDPAQPEVLVFGPDGHGNLKLVALEYVVFQEPWVAEHGSLVPTLFGQSLKFVPAPNRYEVPAFFQIHAWLWESNPAGTFADFNPVVSCD